MEIGSREQSDDMMTSIDRVVERVERQAKRMIARRKQRKPRRAPQPLPAAPAVEAEEEEGPEIEDAFAPVLVREEAFHAEPISVEEAIELLQTRDQDLLLFTNRQGGAVTLVYLRPDGNYAMIEGA